jgi:beta-glucanase (GH16 family)
MFEQSIDTDKLAAKRRRPATLAHLAMILAVAGAAFSWSSRPAEAKWKIIFEDKFDGNALNRSTWFTRYIYNKGKQDHLNDEQQRFRDGGHHVQSDGTLKLVATKVHDDGRRDAYESGMIRSRMTFRYGYVEARIKVPSGRGLWSSFWLNSDYGPKGRLNWPPEIDIFEYVVNGTTELPNYLHSNVAVGKSKAQGGEILYADPDFNKRWTYYKAPQDLSKDWHVFGMLWEPDKVTTYLDGKKLFTKAYKWVYNDGVEAGPAHILFDLAIGGKWAGRNGIDDSLFPAKLEVDYIRVCQRSDIGMPTCGGSKFTPQ